MMILYHPAKDINHCIYRFLIILSRLDVGVSFDKLRVLDFYFLFPHLLKEIKPWPNDIRKYKSIALSVPDSYEEVPNKRRLFYEMLPMQKRALSVIISKELLSIDDWEQGLLICQHDSFPSRINEISELDDFLSQEVMAIILDGLTSTEWEGVSGLKRRSGLLEYKYDE